MISLVMGKALQMTMSRHPPTNTGAAVLWERADLSKPKALLLTVVDNIYIGLEECPV